GVPDNSRAASGRGNGALEADDVTAEKLVKINHLNDIAVQRGQTLAQMSLAWVLHNPIITSLILGVSRPEQITDSLQSLQNYHFTKEELKSINTILQ
ncbi:MAG: aldo/keto reductase, partial [Ginsengibacter sp.]